MEVNNAKEYIEILDAAGESWSNDNEALNDAMEDYAKMYHEHKLKLLGIADVSNRRELLKAYEQANNPCDCDSCKETANERIEKYLSL